MIAIFIGIIAFLMIIFLFSILFFVRGDAPWNFNDFIDHIITHTPWVKSALMIIFIGFVAGLAKIIAELVAKFCKSR